MVDHNAFLIWKDEIFSQWLDPWAEVYGQGSESYKFLQHCQESFYLINIVDNDFINGDLDKILDDFIKTNQELLDSIE